MDEDEEEIAEDDHDHDDHDHDHEHEALRAELRLAELTPSKFPSYVNKKGEAEEDKTKAGMSGANSKEAGELIRQACRRL